LFIIRGFPFRVKPAGPPPNPGLQASLPHPRPALQVMVFQEFREMKIKPAPAGGGGARGMEPGRGLAASQARKFFLSTEGKKTFGT